MLQEPNTHVNFEHLNLYSKTKKLRELTKCTWIIFFVRAHKVWTTLSITIFRLLNATCTLLLTTGYQCCYHKLFPNVLLSYTFFKCWQSSTTFMHHFACTFFLCFNLQEEIVQHKWLSCWLEPLISFRVFVKKKFYNLNYYST